MSGQPVTCPCGGGIQACAHLGRIPVFAVCVWCRAEFMVRLDENGRPEIEKREVPDD